MKDKMMICKEGHPDCLCRHKKPHKYSNDCKQLSRHGCKACIPYEPEPHKIAICEDCKLKIICAIKGLGKKECDLYQTEPQPEQCPESVEIIVCKMCFKPRDASVNPCPSCGYGADLQPKHCTHTIYKGDKANCYFESCESCEFFKEQPTPTMPLREQIFQQIHSVRHGRKDGSIPNTKDVTDYIVKLIEAHDSAIASKAVKDAKEALECAEYALSHPESNQAFALNAVQQALASIRAMAEGKE